MVDAQVFRWFCKEQKIMPKIREMYYEINPYISPFRVFNENFILVNSEVSFTVEPPDTYTVSAKFSFTPSTLEI